MPAVKRSAETQLTRDHEEVEDDDIMEIMPVEGFKKADQSVLATRPMKGLPKRSNAVAATYDAPGSQKLNFGVPSQSFAAPNSSFTFTASAPTTATPQPPSTNTPFKFSAPTVSPSASYSSKQLASLLSSEPQPNGIHASTSSKKSSDSLKDDPEVKYYASLRGLNESFRAEMEEILEEDPLVDLRCLLDMYEEYRAKIQKEFDDSCQPQKSAPVNGVSSGTSPKPSSSGLSMPTPPKAFAGFGSSSAAGPSTSTAPTPSGGGFRPNLDAMPTSATPSAFKFGSSSATEESSSPTTSPFGASGSSQSPFGASSTTLKPSPFGGASSSSFQFGSTSTSTANKPSSSFGSGSAFGGAATFGKSNGPSSSTSAMSNMFGSSGPGASASVFGDSSSSAAVFGVGATKPPSDTFRNTGGFAFGTKTTAATEEDARESSADSESEPVASSSKTISPFGALPSKSPFGVITGASTSGGPDPTTVSSKPSAPAPVTSAAESRSNTPVSTEGSELPTGGTSTPNVLGDNPHDLEGEGEENEVTVHTERGKLFKLGKEGEKMAWHDFGVGMVRLKKHKENGSLRLLSRNSGNGKIIMNFKLYRGFKVTRAKQVLNFVGHEGTERASYRIRVKDEGAAEAFRKAVAKEVSSLEA